MKNVKEKHVFVDVDNTLLVAKSLGSFSPYDLLDDEERSVPLPLRKKLKDSYQEEITEALKKLMDENPVFTWTDGDPSEYEQSMKDTVLKEYAIRAGYVPVDFDDGDRYIVAPRPGAKEFIEKLQGLVDHVWVCSTATGDYLDLALGEVMGIKDMFEGIIDRYTLYGSVDGVRDCWTWDGAPKFVLIDDLPPGSCGIADKLTFLGLELNGIKMSGWNQSEEDKATVEKHLVTADSYDYPAPSDVYLEKAFEEIKSKIEAMG